MPELLKSVELGNGLSLSFSDHSNRYYGDFHRVCIAVKAEVPLALLELSEPLKKSAKQLSDPLCYEKTLERMGVATADLPQVKETLIEDFLRTSRGYLEQPTFPQQLLQKKLTEKPRPSFLLRR